LAQQKRILLFGTENKNSFVWYSKQNNSSVWHKTRILLFGTSNKKSSVWHIKHKNSSVWHSKQKNLCLGWTWMWCAERGGECTEC
jgi:hypothetical protein